MPELAWRLFNTAWVKIPWPNKIDRFVHNDRDRKRELLSLSFFNRQIFIWLFSLVAFKIVDTKMQL